MTETQKFIEQTHDFINSRKFFLPPSPSRGAMIVETREVPDFEYIVKNHLHFSGSMGLTVFHGPHNEKYVKECLKDITGVIYKTVYSAIMTIDTYNNFMVSRLLWENTPYQKTMVFQSDSLLLRPVLDYFWHCFDYIGAPWYWAKEDMRGGNGGLSIRTTKHCLGVIKNCPKFNVNTNGNEDLYFSHFIDAEKGYVNTREEGMAFSVETIYHNTPTGIHAAEKYLPKEQMKTIFDNALSHFK